MCQQCAKLRAIIMELEERCRIIEDDTRWCRLPGLRKKEWLLVKALMLRREMTREALLAVIWGEKPEADWPTDIRSVDQHVSRTNRTLAHYQIRIQGIVGLGYGLDAKTIKKLRRLCARGSHLGADYWGDDDEVATVPSLGVTHRSVAAHTRAKAPPARRRALHDDAYYGGAVAA